MNFKKSLLIVLSFFLMNAYFLLTPAVQAAQSVCLQTFLDTFAQGEFAS
jgi:hypothetical protein